MRLKVISLSLSILLAGSLMAMLVGLGCAVLCYSKEEDELAYYTLKQLAEYMGVPMPMYGWDFPECRGTLGCFLKSLGYIGFTSGRYSYRVGAHEFGHYYWRQRHGYDIDEGPSEGYARAFEDLWMSQSFPCQVCGLQVLAGGRERVVCPRCGSEYARD
ncbi:MAG: hypothetical protein QW587_04645 [Candidatus Bathyarchaeia archaeon]